MAKKKSALTKSKTNVPTKSDVYDRIREILESARRNVARSVNTTQVVSNWLIGREIVEEEQAGIARAGYGKRLLPELSKRLQEEFGRGYSLKNLEYFRSFYLIYPNLIDSRISHTLCTKLEDVLRPQTSESLEHLIVDTETRWTPSKLSVNLSWSHYRRLLRIESEATRSFYEIEAIDSNWSVRELERQINSLLFERLAKSKDKHGVMELAIRGQEIMSPLDIFKDPVVIEFVGLPESNRLVESDLETS